MIGSATAPQLDLSFVVTESAPPATSSCTPRTPISSPADQFLLTLGGTNSGGSGSVQGRAWGGTSNTEFQFSGANLLSSLGPFTTAAFSGKRTSPFTPAANPYSLTIGTTDLARDRRNEHRQPEPAGLGDPGTEHLGVDTDGGGARRLRRPPAPPALGSSRTSKARFGGLCLFQRAPAALSRAWFGARTSAAGASR